MYFDDDFPVYVTIAQRKARAEKSRQKLAKTQANLEPVVISGKDIATTWWGKAWNKNLEGYADFKSRLARGRTYLKDGAVLDLKIEKGLVKAFVQGSGSMPYKVEVRIDPLSPAKWQAIQTMCSHRIGSLAELVEGKFPRDLEALFTSRDSGLFPSGSEIEFTCTCPDWALLCKHVAAVLYGIGARFDQDPTLFFKLRDIDFQVLLKKSVEDKMANLLANAGKKSSRVLDEEDVSRLFEI